MLLLCCSQLWRSLHQLRPLLVQEGAEGQAIPPGGREVGDGDTSVALRLLLTPAQQPSRMNVRLCRGTINTLTSVSFKGRTKRRTKHLHSRREARSSWDPPGTIPGSSRDPPGISGCKHSCVQTLLQQLREHQTMSAGLWPEPDVGVILCSCIVLEDVCQPITQVIH